MTEKRIDLNELSKTAICVALLSVSSFMAFPLPFTPVVLSLQTVMVNIIGIVLKPKNAFYGVFTYILMGLIGLPVFSAGTSGPGKLFGPTGGFYFGFLFSAVAISLLKGKDINFKRYAVTTVFVGIPIQHICAVLVMCMHNDFNLKGGIVSASAPFIIGDICKAIASSVIGVALNKALKKSNKFHGE